MYQGYHRRLSLTADCSLGGIPCRRDPGVCVEFVGFGNPHILHYHAEGQAVRLVIGVFHLVVL